MLKQLTIRDRIQETQSFSIQIPMDQLNLHALYTMEEDAPPFVLPFSCEVRENHLEITYDTANCIPIKECAGMLSMAQYCALFREILTPFCSCRDWFMDPGNFILDEEYLFFQESTQTFGYLYIPVKESSFGNDELTVLLKQLNRRLEIDNYRFRMAVLEYLERDVWTVEEFMELLSEDTAAWTPDMFYSLYTGKKRKYRKLKDKLAEPEDPVMPPLYYGNDDVVNRVYREEQAQKNMP